MKDQASYIIVDGKPKRRSVQQAAPTEYGPSGDKSIKSYLYSNNRFFIRYRTKHIIKQIYKYIKHNIPEFIK